MKKITILSMLLFFCLEAIAFATSPQVRNAQMYGAKAKVTFCVGDSSGTSVENAKINVAFSNQRKGAMVIDGISDTNGCFSVEGLSDSDLNYTIIKDGYYITTGRYWFYRGKEECVEKGHWVPWNPQVSITLKPQKKPIPMYVKRVDIEILEQNKPIGFDLEKGDWVAPYGGGNVADINIIFTNKREGIQYYWKKLILCAVNPFEGISVLKRDDSSEFVSGYNAPENGYSPEFIFERKRTKTEIQIYETNKDNEYFILRSRVVLDETGELVSANYSKIYGPIEYAVGKKKNRLKFTYYFNPNPNDRNLEFDPDKNLFEGRDRFAP